MFLYVLSSVLLCCYVLYDFCKKKNDVLFVFTSSCLYESSCFIYVRCVCLGIVLSNKYYVVFLFWLSSSGVPVSLDCPFLISPSVFSNVYL